MVSCRMAQEFREREVFLGWPHLISEPLRTRALLGKRESKWEKDCTQGGAPCCCTEDSGDTQQGTAEAARDWKQPQLMAIKEPKTMGNQALPMI